MQNLLATKSLPLGEKVSVKPTDEGYYPTKRYAEIYSRSAKSRRADKFLIRISRTTKEAK